MKLIATKIIPPRTRIGVVDRPQLTGRLDEVLNTKISVLKAPAGYGKTSLLVQWHAIARDRGIKAGWVSLDEGDRSAVELLAYVVMALGNDDPGLVSGAAMLVETEGAATEDVVIAALVNDLVRSSVPVVIFFDDLHLLRSPDVRRALSILIDCAPANVRFVMATRERPDLQLARLRMLGAILELTMDDLRFSTEEIVRFLTKTGHGALNPETIATLETRTEGWIAGLQMASLMLKADPGAERAMVSLSGRQRAFTDFFAEDVVGRYPNDIQEFLLKTSVLDRLCPALCDVVTGHDNSHRILDEIESLGLFLFSIDNERTWYRYHHLFSEHLRQRLARRHPGTERELHRRASQWLADAGFEIEAFDHAMKADDPTLAASILDRYAFSFLYRGQVRMLLTLADRLPHDIRIHFPRLVLTSAWSLIIQWRFSEARPLLAAARDRIAEMRRNQEVDPSDLRKLDFLLLHREMMLAQFVDDMPLVERQCIELIESSLEIDAYVTGTLYTSLIFAEREQFKLDSVSRHEARALEHFKRAGSRFVIVWHQSIVGPSRFLAGDTEAALRSLDEGARAAEFIAGRVSPLASIPELLRAEVHYERNEIAEAERLCNSYLPLANELGFIDHLVAGYLTHARLLWQSGNRRAATKTLLEGIDLARTRGFDRLKKNLLGEQIAFLLRDGRPDEAQAAAARNGFAIDRDAILPRPQVTTRIEAEAMAWARLAVSRHQIVEALQLAAQWRSFLDRAGAVRLAVRWDILTAQLLVYQDNPQAAQRTLRRAVDAAAPNGLIRSFVDEGAVVEMLLRRMFAGTGRLVGEADRFGVRLLDAFGHKPSNDTSDGGEPPPIESLKTREIEILRFIAMGMTNKEIALRLGMTEGSVKWYLQQIYDKLGTRRRSVAAQRARRYGLLQLA